MKRVFLLATICLFLAAPCVLAKDKKDKKDKPEPSIVMLWPDSAAPTIKLTFGRFVQLATYNGQLSLESQVLIENVSARRIPLASFTVYLLDKDKVRVGNGNLSFTDLDAGQQAKLAFQVFSVGVPSTLSLAARNDASGIPTSLRTVPLNVVSVPAGAAIRLDGRDAGITPTTVRLTTGNHVLSFSKEGYASGSTPVDIKPDEAPGGSISFELGGLSRDNVELRNGAVLEGDVISMSMTDVVVRVDGKDQTVPRNQVRKMILVERIVTEHPPVTPTVPAKPNQ
ncbi:MAG TPA: PEGA domain-containing protein [Candidatus Dormibacteraeota bacterium]|nr:PEGA domain-containing protein [Candidatus Dormibacteraeota bacterium]